MYLLLVLDWQYRNLLEVYGYFSSYILTEAASKKISNPTIILKIAFLCLERPEDKVVVVYTNENDYFDVIDILSLTEDITKYGDCKTIVKNVILYNSKE